ncbi:MAG: LysR substrate-binding domain-containing protein [Actinomycetota bacterium]
MTGIDGTGRSPTPRTQSGVPAAPAAGFESTVPDRWLRVFAETAAAPSFTEAGRRLGLGQSAVSHTIGRLEAAIGRPLFERHRAGAHLTTTGRLMADAVGPAFRLIDGAVAEAREQSASAVTVSVSTSLATYWLMPRLARFKLREPGIDLRCITNDDDSGNGLRNADVWIPLGPGPWPEADERDFCPEAVYPVASTELLRREGIGRPDEAPPAAVLDLPLLHLEERYRPRFDWARWTGRHGLAPTDRAPAMISNDYSLILHAALDGQGVALGWHHIVAPLVAAGRLHRLSPEVVTTDRPFKVLSRPGVADGEPAGRLRAWLVEEAAAGPAAGGSIEGDAALA